MANEKISGLGLAAPLTGSEESEVLQTGANKRVSKATDKEFFRRSLPNPTLAQDADTLTARETALTAAINALKDGVPPAGDTLNKLYNLITALGRPRGAFDASSGAVPTPTADNEAGDFWRITVAGTIGTMVLKPGDVLIASIDDAAVAADFYAVQTNLDQASETEQGIAEIATQAETNTGTDDARFVTPKKLKDQNFLAPLASPALTGTPTAPTPAASDNSTKISTTQYVDTAVSGAFQDTTTLAIYKISNFGTP